jgi:hypothetical protein
VCGRKIFGIHNKEENVKRSKRNRTKKRGERREEKSRVGGMREESG